MPENPGRVSHKCRLHLVKYSGEGFEDETQTEPVCRRACSHAVVARFWKGRIVRHGFINGLPGFVTIEQDDTLQTTALQIADGKIAAIYVMRNPDKLRHLGDYAVH